MHGREGDREKGDGRWIAVGNEEWKSAWEGEQGKAGWR